MKISGLTFHENSENMGTKRAAPPVHASRREQVPAEPRRKRQKSNNHAPAKFQTTHPVNQLKSRIRSHRRLLEKNANLPADVRVQTERALKAAELELEQNERAKKRNDMIGRYHKIRFFDRQKATKKLAKAKKEFEACDKKDHSTSNALRQRVEDHEVDVNYAIYYPLETAYVSLFPRRKEGEQDDDANLPERKGDPEMWSRVKQCMADGSLHDLRHGRLGLVKDRKHDREVDSSTRPGKAKHKNSVRHKQSSEHHAQDEEHNADSPSDGEDFFY